MKTRFVRMLEVMEFVEFWYEFKNTGAYFIASSDASEESKKALAVCIATAFEAGFIAGGQNEKNRRGGLASSMGA